MDKAEWEETKRSPLRHLDHSRLDGDKAITDFREIGLVDQLVKKVSSLPDYTLFVALFRSADDAVNAAKRLPFASSEKGDISGSPVVVKYMTKSGHTDKGTGVTLPDGVYAGILSVVPDLANIFIIGGCLKREQRNDVFTTFERTGKVACVVMPAGAPPLQKKSSGWKFWE